ncbi:MAG TPA: cyclic peptide export ABC transporter [Pyrinomonadaceae bacterium]|nr:cyclic peptide export ABC transporter [Pyrinomonadaceae bacterium]
MRNLIQLTYTIAKWSKGLRHSRSMMIVAIVASFLAGIGYTLLVALIKQILTDGSFTKSTAIWTFMALCLVIPVFGFVSQYILLDLTSRAAYELRSQLSRQILSAPMRQLEKLGPHRLLATITEDIGSVIELVTILPQMLTQVAMMAGCLVYLGWLSWKLMLVMLVYMGLGLLSHQLPLMRSFHYFRLTREQWDAMYNAFHGLILGTKELKLNTQRREGFLSQQLEPAALALQRYGMKGNAIAMAVSNWGQILFFVFIGLLLFVTPYILAVEGQILVGYTLAVLFLITPLTMVLNQIPALERAALAAERIEELGLSLAEAKPESLALRPAPDTSWRRLDLVDVTHVYRHDGADEEFELGPISLSMQPGEVIFLIGGNGSGKTTLVKLLMGLYQPDSGEIRVDGKSITEDVRDDYRQRFSVVFFDFYLFDRLFGAEASDLDERSESYLKLLQLSHKLQVRDGRLSTIELSQGQRKRLALLSAYLEDRPIYIFDEWAADQDPQFKQIFYYQLLPDLKARGKTVIVISHDDRYYNLADRVIKLESGKLEYDEQVTPHEAQVSTAVVH